MVHFNPDSKDAIRHSFPDSSSQPLTIGEIIGNVLMLLLIFILLRAFMLIMNVGIMTIPVVDRSLLHGMHTLENKLEELRY